MPKIKVVTDAMIERANFIGQNAEIILENQNNVTNIFKNLGRGFSGKIPSLMTQHMLAMDPEYKNMNGILNNYKNFLEDAAQKYEWTEEELTKFAQSLAGSNTATGNNNNDNNNLNYSNSTEINNDDNNFQADQNNSTSENSAPSTPVNNNGGWDASGGWDTVGDSFPHNPPDLNSIYYDGSNPEGKQLAYHKRGDHGVNSMDCCFYARSRAMEVRGWTKTYGTYTTTDDLNAIKNGDRVVRFDKANGGMHFVYVEAYDPNTDTVYFSDANMGGSPATDGRLKSINFNEFSKYISNAKGVYVEIP